MGTERQRLTDRAIKALALPESGTLKIYDEGSPGLCLVAHPNGRKVWRYLYTIGGRGGRRDQVTLGTYPEIGLAKARELHRDARALVQQGINPAQVKQQARTEPTFGDLVDDYLKSPAYAAFSVETRKEYERVLRAILPKLKTIRAGQITKHHVQAAIQPYLDRNRRVMANKARGLISRIIDRAIRLDLVNLSANPCQWVKVEGGTARERDRVLTEDEIRRYWAGLDASDFTRQTVAVLKLALVLMQRKGTIVRMRFEDLDLERRVWTIPAAHMKTRRVHAVPLSPFALEILEPLLRYRLGEEWVFASPFNPALPLHPDGLNYGHGKVRRAAGIDDFRVHDLRRSAATYLAAGGAGRLLVSKILGHREGGITRIYERWAYIEEMRPHMDAWGERVRAITTDPPCSAARVG